MDLLFYVSLNLLSISMGAEEAILYSRKGADAFKWNEHILFVVNRALCAACILISPFTDDRVIILIACIFFFPFIHDGAYYVTRGKIDMPQYRFNSDSTGSTATLEIKFKYRVALFLMGIGIIITHYLNGFQGLAKILKFI